MKYNKKTTIETLAADLVTIEKMIIKQVKKIKQLDKENRLDDEYKDIKSFLELLKSASTSVGYIAQTYTPIHKNIILENQLKAVEKQIEIMKHILPHDIYNKYLNEAKQILNKKTAIVK